MKRAIITKYTQLNEKLTGYVGMMNYNYLNLCVKAEEVSLLPVKPVIEGKPENLEDLALTAKKGDYEMMIIPKFEDDLPSIVEAIVKTHPEFKRTIDKLEAKVPDLNGETETRWTPYILLTMPEVDDDRYDELTKLADAINDYTKGRIDTAIAKTMADLAPLLLEELPCDADKIKENFEKLKNDKHDQREKLHEDKLKEIKEGYKKWLTGYAKSEVENMEKEDAEGFDVSMSMRMTSEEDIN